MLFTAWRSVNYDSLCMTRLYAMRRAVTLANLTTCRTWKIAVRCCRVLLELKCFISSPHSPSSTGTSILHMEEKTDWQSDVLSIHCVSKLFTLSSAVTSWHAT